MISFAGQILQITLNGDLLDWRRFRFGRNDCEIGYLMDVSVSFDVSSSLDVFL
jgi:hypothetical protein